MRGVGYALLPALLANLAFADVPTTSPRPMPRPEPMLAARVQPYSVRPRSRPVGLGEVTANPLELNTTGLPAKQLPASMKGAVCRNPQIKGQSLRAVTSRIKGCSLKAPVLVSSVSGVALNPPATINCDAAEALSTWVVKGVQPAFHNTVVRMNVADSYSCRPRNNVRGAKISEHGSGNAIDIAGFITNSGRAYTVAENYNSMIRAAQKFGCGIFHTVLGPGSDGYHENHLHFDVAPYRGHPYCR